MRKYGDKVRISTYIDVDLYNRIEEERQKTNETQSGMIYSVLDACFREPIPSNI